MAYLLDSDVFIQAQNMHYSFAVCPAFWGWVDKEHSKGKIFSIKRVQKELLERQDELSAWAKTRKSLFLSSDDGETFESFKILAAWATKNFKPAAQVKFFNGADFQLVGYAHSHGHTIVTQETFSTGFEIKIPTACDAMGIKCINTFQLLKSEGARFILDE